MSDRSIRELSICSKYRGFSSKPVPELRVVGEWFRQLGFDIGDKVTITTRERLLIIQPVQKGDGSTD